MDLLVAGNIGRTELQKSREDFFYYYYKIVFLCFWYFGTGCASKCIKLV